MYIERELRAELEALSVKAYTHAKTGAGIKSAYQKLIKNGELVQAKIIKGETPHKVWKKVDANRAREIMQAKIDADTAEVAKLEALKAEKAAKMAEIDAQVAANKEKELTGNKAE